MNTIKETYDVGIIVGRFQCGTLHEGHLELIQSVIDNHNMVIVFLGISPLTSSKQSPLTYPMRLSMLLEAFPNIVVAYINDVPSDELWSHNLDKQIETLTNPAQTVALYGSRDSFIEHYKGKHPTIELKPSSVISATEERRRIGKSIRSTPEYREGIIWATQNKYDTVYTTVDIAIMDYSDCHTTSTNSPHTADYSKARLLLGKKPNEDLWRFVGGFSSPKSDSFEDDARREVMEETGLELSDYKYVGSFNIDDWRYRNEDDKIRTMFYIAEYCFGTPKAADDIAELRWFNLEKLNCNQIVPEHHVLFHNLIKEIWPEKDQLETMLSSYAPTERGDDYVCPGTILPYYKYRNLNQNNSKPPEKPNTVYIRESTGRQVDKPATPRSSKTKKGGK